MRPTPASIVTLQVPEGLEEGRVAVDWASGGGQFLSVWPSGVTLQLHLDGDEEPVALRPLASCEDGRSNFEFDEAGYRYGHLDIRVPPGTEQVILYLESDDSLPLSCE